MYAATVVLFVWIGFVLYCICVLFVLYCICVLFVLYCICVLFVLYCICVLFVLYCICVLFVSIFTLCYLYIPINTLILCDLGCVNCNSLAVHSNLSAAEHVSRIVQNYVKCLLEITVIFYHCIDF